MRWQHTNSVNKFTLWNLPMLKYLPQKSLKIIEDFLLYNKKRVSCTCNIDRRLNNSNIPADITNNNIDDRIPKFAGVTNNK